MSERKPALRPARSAHPAAPPAEPAASPSTTTPSPASRARAAVPASDAPPRDDVRYRNPKYAQLNARVPEDLRRKVKIYAATHEGESTSTVVEKALIAFFEPLEK